MDGASSEPNRLPPGAKGWRTHAVVTPAEARTLPRFDRVPLTAHLSTLGGTGLTAYVALTRIAN